MVTKENICCDVDFKRMLDCGKGMSNCNHEVDAELENLLRQVPKGTYGFHYAWDFCGVVWFDDLVNMFFELVQVRGKAVGLVS